MSAKVDSAGRHPPGLCVLYLTEVWERFSFYGMKALLVLYLNDGILLEEKLSNVFGGSLVVACFSQPRSSAEVQALSSTLNELYAGTAYLTPIAGGLLADGLLGARATLLLGGVLMALGHLCMAFEQSFLIGLLLLVLGNGGFKPTITSSAMHWDLELHAACARRLSVFAARVASGSALAPI